MVYEFFISKFFRRVVEKTSLHGVFHLTNNQSSLFEKILWAIIIWTVVIAAIFLMTIFWVRYLTNPTVISLDRDYHEWNATFPSLTVCFHDRLNVSARDSLVEQMNPIDPERFRAFLTTLATTDLFGMDPLVKYDEYSNLDLKLMLNEITNVVDTSAMLENGIKVQLRRIITDMGICYAFNSAILKFLSIGALEDEVYDENLVEISIIEQDIAAILSGLTSNGNIYYHGPLEIPTILRKLIVKNTVPAFLNMKFKPVTVSADSTIENLFVQQRNCRFPYESNLEFYPEYYTNNLCMLECRLKLFIQICGCIPHFYNTAAYLPTCRLRQLSCFSKNAVKFRLSLASCGCLKDCNAISFTLQSYVLFDWFEDPLIKWEMDFQKVRYSRKIIFGFADAMASTGGIAALFFGASFVTIVELIFLLLRNISKC